MSKSKSPTEWLDSAIDELYTLKSGGREKFKQAILNHVEELVNEVIGSDEPLVDVYQPHQVAALQREVNYDRTLRNALRSVQRTQAKQLLKGKD